KHCAAAAREGLARGNNGTRLDPSAGCTRQPCSSGSRKQNGETLLREVVIVGQDVGQPALLHQEHGTAIGETVTLVRAALVEAQRVEEPRAILRDDFYVRRVVQITNALCGIRAGSRTARREP